MHDVPEKFSSFCFLPPSQREKLKALIAGIDEIVIDFKMRSAEGNDDLAAIKTRKIVKSVDDSQGTYSQYDANISAWEKELFSRDKERLNKAWDTCMVGCDQLQDLITKQEEAGKLLMKAETGLPQHGGHAWQHAMRDLNPLLRKTMNETYDTMHAFVSLPCQRVYDEQIVKLAAMTKELTTLTTYHTRFCQLSAIHPAPVRLKGLKQLNIRANSLADQLDIIDFSIINTFGNLPDLGRLRDTLEHISGAVRHS